MKTSEFWLTCVVIGAIVALAMFGKATTEIVSTIGGLSGVYIAGRSWVKGKNGADCDGSAKRKMAYARGARTSKPPPGDS